MITIIDSVAITIIEGTLTPSQRSRVMSRFAAKTLVPIFLSGAYCIGWDGIVNLTSEWRPGAKRPQVGHAAVTASQVAVA